ncbi:MAG: bifunctional diaminohydroxyphosphoribosylaminopyrimidine deaminase/5-amino-6-(5-phosphoribosylamino)uracil reductase RibD [Myxococcota bacterium]
MRSLDLRMVRRALELGVRGLGATAPNPPVGAVVARGEQVLGEGFTQPPGGAHAEVMALADCRARGHDPRGATMYVTLEPCCHHGRTPPCTDALVAAGVRRVVIGVLDPFPAMRGRSVAVLRDAGVEVELGVEEEACARRILGFARALGYGLPEVTLKAGVSADGASATITGESKWITSAEARAAGHQLRAHHDAVLVGLGTVLADDPLLTTRLPDVARDAVPVVLDTALRIPATARLFGSSRRPLIVCAEDAPPRDLPADLIHVPRDAHGRVDLEAALRALVGRGLHRVLVEGGATVHRSVLDRGLADTLELFVAPVLLPGGRGFVGGPPVASLAAAYPMSLHQVGIVGRDVRMTFDLVHAIAPDPLRPLRAEKADTGRAG